MKRLMLTALTAAMGTAVVMAQIPASTPVGSRAAAAKPATTPKTASTAKNAGAAETARKIRSVPARQALVQVLTQLENDWVQALKTKNAEKLAAILGDDWKGVGWDGRVADKAAALAALKTDSLDSIEMGPMEVRVFGAVAVVTGSDTEKSRTNGKDSSGKYVWTDVFVQRNSDWQAVASQSARVP
ncbi:MAG TPA: nuclear transport factor 2 family protein [Bryobacteraceae bacterium]|nr:nuclear transport factor 2 family protein [Bryobacteraceae bacterium]